MRNPAGETCCFDEEKHRYTVNGTELTSATRFVGSFFPEFDKESISKKYADKHRMAQAEVLAKWKAINEESTRMGSLVHSYCEHKALQKLSQFDLECLTDDDQSRCRAADMAFEDLQKRFNVVDAEKIVFDSFIGLAGTIDLLLEDVESNAIIIFDWKTNRRILKSNFFGKVANLPIDFLDDCNYNEYCLQLNVYRLILIRQGYFPGKNIRMALTHLMPDKYQPYRVPCMESVIEKMLAWV